MANAKNQIKFSVQVKELLIVNEFIDIVIANYAVITSYAEDCLLSVLESIKNRISTKQLKYRDKQEKKIQLVFREYEALAMRAAVKGINWLDKRVAKYKEYILSFYMIFFDFERKTDNNE